MNTRLQVSVVALTVLLLLVSLTVLADGFTSVYSESGVVIGRDEGEGEGVLDDTLEFTHPDSKIFFGPEEGEGEIDLIGSAIEFCPECYAHVDEPLDQNKMGLSREGKWHFYLRAPYDLNYRSPWSFALAEHDLMQIAGDNYLSIQTNLSPSEEGELYFQGLFLARSPWDRNFQSPVFSEGETRIETNASLFSTYRNIAVATTTINNAPEPASDQPIEGEAIEGEGPAEPAYTGFDIVGGLIVHGDEADTLDPPGTVEIRNTSKAGVKVTMEGSVIITLGGDFGEVPENCE